MPEVKVENIPINPADHKLLIDSANEIAALEKMMDMFQSQFQERYSRAHHKARVAWNNIRQANPGIDFDKIIYVPSETTPAIVPTQVNLGGKNAR